MVRQLSRANNVILADDNRVSETTNTKNDLDMKKEVKEQKLHQMAKVHNLLEM